MQIYDSGNPPVKAVAVGPTVVLTAIAQGTPTPDKAVSGTATRFSVSNPVLENGGLRLSGMTSMVTLNAVVGTNSLTIGSKTYVGGTDFAIGGNDTATAVLLAAAINLPVLEAQPSWVFNHENIQLDAKVVGTGAVSASVDVEHSHNGQDWSLLATLAPSGTTSAVATSAQQRPKPFLRAKPTALTGTSARVVVGVTGLPS
jgi:hypothetical protein